MTSSTKYQNTKEINWLKQLFKITKIEINNLLSKQNLIYVSEKRQKDFVTSIDHAIGNLLCNKISQDFPKDKIICEDVSESLDDLLNTGSGKLWIVDPIDGTTNLYKNLPFFCVSISCIDLDTKTFFLSGIMAPTLDLEVITYLDGDVLVNNKIARISKIDSIEKSLVLYGLSKNVPIDSKQHGAVNFFSSKSIGTRRSGSAALDLMFVAIGMADSYFHYDLKPWDVAAGVHLVKNAGGSITNIGHETFSFANPSIIAANNQLANLMSAELIKF